MRVRGLCTSTVAVVSGGNVAQLVGTIERAVVASGGDAACQPAQARALVRTVGAVNLSAAAAPRTQRAAQHCTSLQRKDFIGNKQRTRAALHCTPSPCMRLRCGLYPIHHRSECLRASVSQSCLVQRYANRSSVSTACTGPGALAIAGESGARASGSHSDSAAEFRAVGVRGFSFETGGRASEWVNVCCENIRDLQLLVQVPSLSTSAVLAQY